MKAWYFLRSNKRLQSLDRNLDNQLVQCNVWYSSEGKISMNKNGMHGSVRLLHALSYAIGPVICRVKIKGEIQKTNTKFVGRRCRVLAMADATDVLYEFACWCAKGALKAEEKAGRKVDQRSWAAIEARRKWLKGEVDNQQLAKAYEAAREAFLETDEADTEAYKAARAAANAARKSSCMAGITARAVSQAADYDATNAACTAAVCAVVTLSEQNRYLTKTINRLLKLDPKNKGKF